jgi:hypothetical protein
MRTRTTFVLSSITALLLGCGGDDTTSDTADQGEGGSPDATATTYEAGSNGGVDGSSGGKDGSSGGKDGSSGDGSSGGNDGSSAGDGAVRGPDGSVVADGGRGGDASGGTTSTLPCGATTCNIPSETCCIDQGNYSCVVGGCPSGDRAALQCNSSENCAAGSVCCLTAPGGGNSVSSACEAAGDGGAACAGGNSTQLCDKNASPTGCPDSGPNSQCDNGNMDTWGLSRAFAHCGNQDGPF